MNELGHYSLVLAWLTGVYAVLALLLFGKSEKFTTSGSRAIPASFLALLVSYVCLTYCFVKSDFSVQYVWQYSNMSMPLIYKITAVWGGMDGSMLLWSLILSICGLLFWITRRRELISFNRWSSAVFISSLLFFETVTLFFTNPFRYLKSEFIPLDGQGLNPLLQNPYMAIHPPMLYIGFTLLAIPYCLVIGRLISREESLWVVKATRVWTLLAWGFLTFGIALGGHWAYLELGWGGFWAWDPVENSSFLPWLTSTAYLHSVMVEQRRGMLKGWNLLLISLSYGLTVFGTFLTRSGIVQSVHAFAETDIGWIFLVYLIFLVLVTLIVFLIRKESLVPNNFIESVFSRELVILVNNLLLISICFAVLWGVMFPVFSEALTGERQTVGIPYFNRVTIPLFLLLFIAMGIGPLFSWKDTKPKNVFKRLSLPLVAAFIVSIIIAWSGLESFYGTTVYGALTIIIFGVIGEFHRGAKRHNTSYGVSYFKLLNKNPSKYGGLIVHLGVVLATIGISASMSHKIEKEFSLEIGKNLAVSNYEFKLTGIESNFNGDYESTLVTTDVFRKVGPNLVKAYTLKPEIRYYPQRQETTSEVALQMGIKHDVYLVLAGIDQLTGQVALKLFINPLQTWLWAGVVLMMIGTLIALVAGKFRSSTA